MNEKMNTKNGKHNIIKTGLEIKEEEEEEEEEPQRRLYPSRSKLDRSALNLDDQTANQSNRGINF